MTVELHPDLEEEVAQEARAEGLTAEDVVALALREHFRRRELERLEDEEDIRVAREVLRTENPTERISWERLKQELNLA